MSLISCNLIKKYISYPSLYSLSGIPKTATFLPPFTTVKPPNNQPYIYLRTTPEHEFSSVSSELPQTPDVLNFDPFPPEKPSDPPPLSPNPAPEFPGPPIPDPEIQPPGPDMPVPPNTPGGPEVVPPATPEWTPPNPPDIGQPHPGPPEIPLPYA